MVVYATMTPDYYMPGNGCLLQTARGLNPRPEAIVIASFNEFHENTHIEPTMTHGDAYIKQTQAFVSALATDDKD